MPQKIASKNADLIVANDVTAEGAGFDVDTNVVNVVSLATASICRCQECPSAKSHTAFLDEVLRLSASVKHTIGRTNRAHARERRDYSPGKITSASKIL